MAPIWIKLAAECLEQDGAEADAAEDIFSFEMPAGADCDGRTVCAALLRRALTSLPGYRQDAGASYVVKLRNSRGSLVPVSRSLIPNTRKNPYTLEVVHVDGRAQASPPCVAAAEPRHQTDAVRRKLSAIAARLSVLEACDAAVDVPEAHRHVNEELCHLKRRMDFLMQRSNASDAADWEGMFRRNPLW